MKVSVREDNGREKVHANLREQEQCRETCAQRVLLKELGLPTISSTKVNIMQRFFFVFAPFLSFSLGLFFSTFLNFLFVVIVGSLQFSYAA